MAIFDKKYRFTSNRHSLKGMMALIFGMISLISFFLAAMISIKNADEMADRMGGAGLFAFIFGMAGLITGIAAVNEPDVFPILPRVGFATALIAVLLWTGVVCAGVLII